MSDVNEIHTSLFGKVLKQVEELSEPSDISNQQTIGPRESNAESNTSRKKQTIILSEDALKLYAQDYLYITEEKSFYERSSDGTYAAIKDDHLRDKLKQRYQLSSNSTDPKILPPNKQVMVYIHDKQRCERAISSLAGYLAGVHEIGSSRVLIKSNLSLMLPVKRSCDTIMDLLKHVFGNEEPYCQLDRFLTWLQSAYLNAYEIYVNKKNIKDVRLTGLALIICGPAQVGKTFLTNQITKIFGNMVGQPFKSMTGKTEFNVDCSRAIHLSVDDQTGTKKYEQRKEHGQNLKSILSGGAQWVQAKHVDAFTVPLYQRLTYSLNTDRDSFSTFPALSDGVRERILALLVNSEKWERFQYIGEYNTINQTITDELPGLLYYLVNKYSPPQCCTGSSFGCKEFIHPDIEEQIDLCTPNATLRELIFDYLTVPGNGDAYAANQEYDYSGGSGILYEKLLNSVVHRDGIRGLVKNVTSFGMRLSELCKEYPEHFRRRERTKNKFQYKISIQGFPLKQTKLEI